MKKKWTASILAFLLTLSLLAGCGAETTSQPDISAETSQSTTVDTPDSEQDVMNDAPEGNPEDQLQEADGNEQETGSSAPESDYELGLAETTFTLSSVQQIRLQEQGHRQQSQRSQQQNAAHQLWRCGCVGPSRPEGGI